MPSGLQVRVIRSAHKWWSAQIATPPPTRSMRSVRRQTCSLMEMASESWSELNHVPTQIKMSMFIHDKVARISSILEKAARTLAHNTEGRGRSWKFGGCILLPTERLKNLCENFAGCFSDFLSSFFRPVDHDKSQSPSQRLAFSSAALVAPYFSIFESRLNRDSSKHPWSKFLNADF